VGVHSMLEKWCRLWSWHEDNLLYWVKANSGADDPDKKDGKIDSQHVDGTIRLITEVSLLDLDSDIPFTTSRNNDGNGIGNSHTTSVATVATDIFQLN